MDESNGNGVYASKSGATAAAAATTTTSSTTNNINNMMTATTTAASAAVAAAAAVTAPLPTSLSSEDLSQSLSEYTDADESISAPTEFLAEFLSAVMLKDYKKALKYCKLILQYEPNNATAKEFYPLILDKLRGAASSDSDENYNKSSSPEMMLELQSSDPSAGESDEAGSAESDDQQVVGVEDDYGVPDEDNFLGEPHSHDSNVSSSSSECDSLSVSVDEDEDDDGVDDDDEEEEDAISSGDDLPIDDQHLLADDGGGGCDAGNNSHSSSGGEGRSRSDATTHSYSSLLLEEEDDIVPVNLQFTKELSSPDLDVSNGNKIPSASCSDSESPTEPLTQRLAAILRSKCGVSNGGENY